MGISKRLDNVLLNKRCLWLLTWQCWLYLHNSLGYFFLLEKFNILGNSFLLIVELRQLENKEIISGLDNWLHCITQCSLGDVFFIGSSLKHSA